MSPYLLDQDDANDYIAHARREWPREACGLAMRHPAGGRVIYPAPNIIGKMHRVAPGTWRPATEAFVIDPKVLQAALHWIPQGFRLDVIYHSHPTGQPDFSRDDRALALAWSRNPLVAETTWLVVGMKDRRAEGSLTAWARAGTVMVERPLVIA